MNPLTRSLKIITVKEGESKMYNLQVQVVAKPKKTSLRVLAYKTIAIVKVPVDNPTLSAAQVKQALKDSLKTYGIT